MSSLIIAIILIILGLTSMKHHKGNEVNIIAIVLILASLGFFGHFLIGVYEVAKDSMSNKTFYWLMTIGLFILFLRIFFLILAGLRHYLLEDELFWFILLLPFTALYTVIWYFTINYFYEKALLGL